MQMGKLIEGLQILAKYEEKGLGEYIAGAEHDIIYGAGADIDYDGETVADKHGDPMPIDKRLSPGDQSRLMELGWFIDEESECWSAYA